jgi:hypothetical protein
LCGGTSSSGFVSNGVADLVSGKTSTPDTQFTGSYSTDTNTVTYNRFNIILSGMHQAGWVMYLTGTNQPSGVQAPLKAVMMSTDPLATKGLLVGQLRSQQQSSYSAANLNASFVLYESATTVPIATGTQGYFTNLMQGTGDGQGNMIIHASAMNENGQAGSTSVGGYPATVGSNGRVALGGSWQGSWLYLYDAADQAIFLDAASNSSIQNLGLGWLEAQSVTTPSAGQYSFTGSMFSFDPSMSPGSGIQTLDASGNISLTQDLGGQGTASLDNIFSGLVTDWNFAGWPNSAYGTYQIDLGGNAQMYCAVISAAVSNAGIPVGRTICANAPGETVGGSSAGWPSITIQQQ